MGVYRKLNEAHPPKLSRTVKIRWILKPPALKPHLMGKTIKAPQSIAMGDQ